jgi:hypothetical protein
MHHLSEIFCGKKLLEKSTAYQVIWLDFYDDFWRKR